MNHFTKTINISIIKNGKTTKHKSFQGASAIEAMSAQGYFVSAPCGGIGKCGKCKIIVKEEKKTGITPEEKLKLTEVELQKGIRLACRYKINQECSIEIMDDDYSLEDKIPGSEIADNLSIRYGAGIDIGTTTIACYLVNLESGITVSEKSIINSQLDFGADVMSRIANIGNNSDNILEIQSRVLRDINKLLSDSVISIGSDVSNIERIVVAGNTTMLHFLLGMGVEQLGVFPYKNNLKSITKKMTNKLAIKVNKNCEIYVLPPASTFIGADIVAGLAVTGLQKGNEICLLVDIGTNAEIIIGNKKKILACSSAMGPAFEGGNITFGMPSIKGAIRKVQIEEDIRITTIGDEKPIGICGSGIIDGIAEMLKKRIIDSNGKIEKEGDFLSCIGEYKGSAAVFLHEKSICITQEDIRQVQLAKSAVFTGICMMVKKYGADFKDISKFYIAGGFGNNINIENALQIGLIPSELRDKIVLVGNASGDGAVKCLSSNEAMQECEEIAGMIETIDLNGIAEFQDLFIQNLNFKISNGF